MPPPPSNQPELLAPAGDWDALRAAVANGADAVYFGLPNFNARHRATNFQPDELPQVLEFLHRHNVRGYVAFNTLIFSDELPDALRAVQALAEAGADAVIVQDLGLARLIHRLVPDLPIHASTQMTLTEPRGIEFVRSLGVERVILARELSLDEIVRIAGETPMPLEVFVHGALCVAYSGQCLTSEALGGRSANRGQCAQACRLPYELYVDGQRRELGDKAYLLSPQDLAAHQLVGDLARAGVCSLKIEGRLKSADYVAVTTQTYRAAIDAAAAGQPFELSQQGKLDLEQSFSRGLSTGFLAGNNHQRLVHARYSKSRGIHVGNLVRKTARGVIVELTAGHARDILKPGDGVVFDEGRPEQDEQGGRVFEVMEEGQGARGRGPGKDALRVEVTFGRGSVNLAALDVGCAVWKTDDPALRRRLERTFARDEVARRAPVNFRIEGRPGTALRLTACDADGVRSSAEWPGPLEAPRKHPLTREVLAEQLGRLGDTPFDLAGIEIDLPEPVMVPKSILNDLRRRVIAELLCARALGLHTRRVHVEALEELRAEVIGRPESPTSQGSALYVMARTLEQLDAVLAWDPPAPLQRPELVYCDFEDIRRYREAVTRAHAAGVPLGLATLRIIKPAEQGLLRQIAHYGADAVLVRNLAGLTFFREHASDTSLIGDFSLNTANELTAQLLLEQGLQRLVPSYDLNWEQLSAMMGRMDPERCEVVIHQHMPMFHMEHCVFAHLLSNGKDHRDCGRPCDRHRVDLRDRVGSAFPLLADTGCRNTVYNSVAQSAAEYVSRMQALGLRHFRVELLRETPAEVGPLLDRYARVLSGQENGRSTWRQLQVLNQIGVTRGTLAKAEVGG